MSMRDLQTWPVMVSRNLMHVEPCIYDEACENVRVQLDNQDEEIDTLERMVGLGENVSPTDIEEVMRVGVDHNKYYIHIPLPPKIDPSVTMMTLMVFVEDEG